mmetsp:Transcript_38919/g.67346  ORF Transcript_38919/g.67346 Transcript_38919/m.67346 type:complete len:214 (-) Transcript_38919:757-1398(-)
MTRRGRVAGTRRGDIVWERVLGETGNGGSAVEARGGGVTGIADAPHRVHAAQRAALHTAAHAVRVKPRAQRVLGHVGARAVARVGAAVRVLPRGDVHTGRRGAHIRGPGAPDASLLTVSQQVLDDTAAGFRSAGLSLQNGHKRQSHGHTHDPHEPRKQQICKRQTVPGSMFKEPVASAAVVDEDHQTQRETTEGVQTLQTLWLLTRRTGLDTG